MPEIGRKTGSLISFVKMKSLGFENAGIGVVRTAIALKDNIIFII